ncbi:MULTISPECIES: hypothetical protein [Siminovitchia]|uniref:Uncharacterized protein n=1 Tax=Siminovitchia sediminis TaxID=1274353 RepID=A0ABW4KN24_9BACI|nr:hypothetical protein [Siminovitchia fortis]
MNAIFNFFASLFYMVLGLVLVVVIGCISIFIIYHLGVWLFSLDKIAHFVKEKDHVVSLFVVGIVFVGGLMLFSTIFGD